MSQESVPLIPREVLFGNPDKLSPRISPDGSMLAYIAPDDGVLNVWVRTVGKDDDRVVTNDRVRGIRMFQWAENGHQILFIQDKGGDENWHIYSVDLPGGAQRDLTPYDGAQARIVGTDPKYPDQLLAAVNNRNAELHDLHRINLATGESRLEIENNVGIAGWVVDPQFQVRAYMVPTEDGGFEVHVRDSAGAPFRTLLTFGPDDALTSTPAAFTPDGKGLYLVSSVDANTAQLRTYDLATGKETLLASDPTFDVSELMVHPTEHHVEAAAFARARNEWEVLDAAIADDFEAIAAVAEGDFGLCNRDLADKTWLVYFNRDDGPVHYYAFDRASKKATFLFTNRKTLEGVKLAKMKPIEFTSRDGFTVHGYLTVPAGSEGKALPMVLNVHGGPWARDGWGFDPESQWFANRGYATLQVNFRGSTGYGKKFLNAANKEWGRKMHNDLVDAVQWAVDQGVADPKRIAILGGSYGGYATLVGMSFTPDLFACGVDIVGPSSLITLIETIPPYWKPLIRVFETRVGSLEREREMLWERSPLSKIEDIRNPLLIAQGANDPRVKKAESIQIVEAMRAKGKTVEYVEYADEGHGFARPENRLDFYAKAEKFLATHLGGRFEA